MIRKLKSGRYRLYSRKKDPKTGKRKNLRDVQDPSGRTEARARRAVLQAPLKTLMTPTIPASFDGTPGSGWTVQDWRLITKDVGKR